MSYSMGPTGARAVTILAALLLAALVGHASPAGALSLAEVEEIYAEAVKSTDGAVVKAAAETLVDGAEGFPAPELLWTRAGLLFLKVKDMQAARVSFERALKADSSMVAARYGLGRVYLDLRDDPERAARELIRAIRTDSTYVEAYYALGQAFLEMGDARTIKAATDALRHDPGYAPAYLLMAQWSLKRKSMDEAMANFRRFLELDPADIQAAYRFALKLLERKDYEELYELASVMRDEAGLPLRAQVRMAWGDYEEALDLFERYQELLPAPEARLYRDISLVGTPEDVAAYEATPAEERGEFLKRFWLRLDPFKVSGGAMRHAEHCRRVWYARQFYGKAKWPWDRRGEVYIRYGDPDWKSAWNDVNAVIPVAVQRIQERMAFQLYGRKAVGMTFYGPVYPVRTQRTIDNPVDEKYSLLGTNTQPISTQLIDREVGLTYYRPVSAGSDQSAVGWEVWIYTTLGSGMEVVFTDEMYTGVYDYAPPPTVAADDIEEVMSSHMSAYRTLVERLPTLAPEAQMRWMEEKLPERYAVNLYEPMEFYYDVASFRGREATADLQVNIGLPLESVYLKGDPDTTVVVERRIALTDTASAETKSLRDNLGVRVSKKVVGRDLVAVDRVDLSARAGAHVLGLQMSRRNTNRLQAYNQAVSIPDYWNGELVLSDLQIAQRIQEVGDGSVDPRFVRGDLAIVPSPSRAFRSGDPLFVYFEIYNLSKDTFGQTRYEVVFEIRVKGKDKPAAFAAHLKRRTGETVSVRYEQIGRSDTQKDYVELDLGGAKPGRYTVVMSVKDLNSGDETSRTGDFRVLKR